MQLRYSNTGQQAPLAWLNASPDTNRVTKSVESVLKSLNTSDGIPVNLVLEWPGSDDVTHRLEYRL